MTVYFGKSIEAIYGATQWAHEGVKSFPIAGTHVYSKMTAFMGSNTKKVAERFFPSFVWNFLVNHKQGLVVTGVVFTVGVGLYAIYDAYTSGGTPPPSTKGRKEFEEAAGDTGGAKLDGVNLFKKTTTTTTKA